jgi:hypothetical protein
MAGKRKKATKREKKKSWVELPMQELISTATSPDTIGHLIKAGTEGYYAARALIPQLSLPEETIKYLRAAERDLLLYGRTLIDARLTAAEEEGEEFPISRLITTATSPEAVGHLVKAWTNACYAARTLVPGLSLPEETTKRLETAGRDILLVGKSIIDARLKDLEQE